MAWSDRCSQGVAVIDEQNTPAPLRPHRFASSVSSCAPFLELTAGTWRRRSGRPDQGDQADLEVNRASPATIRWRANSAMGGFLPTPGQPSADLFFLLRRERPWIGGGFRCRGDPPGQAAGRGRR